MPSDPFVDRLVADLKPVRRRSAAGDAALLALAGAAELALFLSLGFMRPDMPVAMEQPSFWWKLGSLGIITLLSAAVAVLSFNPVVSPRRGLRWLAALIAASLAAGWLVDAAQAGLPALLERLRWQDGLGCMAKMVALSVPAVVAFGLLMRRGAATDTAGTALASGIAAAAWGAFVFVFACPFDDPLYIAVWYAAGCGLVTGFARLALPRLTGW
jgi:hypothetical protein